MKQLIKNFIWFLFKPNSTTACCLIINLSNYMSLSDIRDSADYLRALYEVKRETINELDKE